MNIFKLKMDTEKYSSFLYELNNNNYNEPFNNCVRFGEVPKDIYTNMKVIEYTTFTKKIRADCSYLANAGKAIIINEKAKKIFDENIQQYVYYIPVYNENERLYIMYTNNIIDALDYDKSIFKCTVSGIKMKIMQHAFYYDKVYGEDIFMVWLDGHIHSTEVFVSERVKKFVENNDLKGLMFQNVWCSEQ